jgi:hypothetical protein
MGKYITNNRQQAIGKNSTFIDTNGEEESSLGEGRRYEHRKMMFTDIKEDQTLTHDWESPKDGVYRRQRRPDTYARLEITERWCLPTPKKQHTRVLTGYTDILKMTRLG